MANITTTGTTGYPTVLDTRTTLVNGAGVDEIIAEHPNGVSAAAIAIETELGTLPKGSAASVKARLAVALNDDGTVKSSVVVGPAVSYAGGIFTVGSGAFDQQGMIGNMTFTAAVAGNALTFALKTKAGTDATATDTITIAFRSSTLTDGTYVARTVTGALAMTVTSGSELGTVNAQAARLYLCAIDNAGTVELAVWNPLRGTSIIPIDEANVVTTTAEGGAGGADSSQVLYSTTARTAVAVRVIGYIEITEATAGTWATSPAVLQIMGVGTPRTGDVIQTAYTSTSTFATGTTAILNDDTPFLSTEGDQYMTLVMTPTNAINLLDHWHVTNFTISSAPIAMAGLFIGASTSAICVSQAQFGSGASTAYIGASTLHYRAIAATTSTIFRLRAGGSSGATTTFNGVSGARAFGGGLISSMQVTEVFV